MRSENGVLIIALLPLQAEIHFVARRIAQAHRTELRAQGANFGEAGFDRRRSGGVVSIGERSLCRFAVGENRGQAIGESARRVRSGILRDRCEAGVDAIKDARFLLTHLSSDVGIDQRITASAAEATAAAPLRRRATAAVIGCRAATPFAACGSRRPRCSAGGWSAAPATGASTATTESADTLALVIAVRIGCDFGVGAAEQFVVSCRSVPVVRLAALAP